MSGDNMAPVIIKRKKVVGGDGHHGGAWKVAYADFVTAMMAFFMLMWLLNATTEKQRKGIADYFTPTIAMARVSGGGNGALGGDSVFAQNTLPRVGTGSTSLYTAATTSKDDDEARFSSGEEGEEDGAAQDEQFKPVEEMLMGRGGESMVADDALKHIVTEVTDEGLVVQFFETDGARLFDEGANPTPLLKELAHVLVQSAEVVENPLAIEAHTSAYPIVVAENPSWSVTAQRAAAFRELLMTERLTPNRIRRVTAFADREPARRNRMDVRNNRIEVVFLRNR